MHEIESEVIHSRPGRPPIKVVKAHSVVKALNAPTLELPDIFAPRQSNPIESFKILFHGNFYRLIKLATINVSITLVSEIFFRSFIFQSFFSSAHIPFLTNVYGFVLPNKQVLINCLMSFFASLFGGMAYFMNRRKHRWYYFIGFGILNSTLAQGLIFLMLPYSKQGFVGRLIFDAAYSATFRFGSFEIFRKPILSSSFRWGPLLKWRLLQDVLLSFFRISAIILFGFSSI